MEKNTLEEDFQSIRLHVSMNGLEKFDKCWKDFREEIKKLKEREKELTLYISDLKASMLLGDFALVVGDVWQQAMNIGYHPHVEELQAFLMEQDGQIAHNLGLDDDNQVLALGDFLKTNKNDRKIVAHPLNWDSSIKSEQEAKDKLLEAGTTYNQKDRVEKLLEICNFLTNGQPFLRR